MRHMQAVKKILFRKGDDGGCAEHVGEKMSFTFFFFCGLWWKTKQTTVVMWWAASGTGETEIVQQVQLE